MPLTKSETLATLLPLPKRKDMVVCTRERESQEWDFAAKVAMVFIEKLEFNKKSNPTNSPFVGLLCGSLC